MPLDASTYDFKPTAPMGEIINAASNKTYKEAQMRAEQQKILMAGLDQFSTGVNNLYNRKTAIGQALAGQKLFASMFGQPQQAQPMATEVPAPQVQPVQNPNETVFPAEGSFSATPGQAPISLDKPVPGALGGIDNTSHAATMSPIPSPLPTSDPTQSNTLAQFLYTGAPQDPAAMMRAMIESGKLSLEQQTKPQEIAIQGRRALAEEENNRIQRMIQGMLAGANIKNQQQERAQAAENASMEANKEISKHFILHPIDAYNATKALASTGQGGLSKVDFSSESEAEKANLPKGTVIKINGRLARVK